MMFRSMLKNLFTLKLAVAGLAAVFVLAACGGSTDRSDTPEALAFDGTLFDIDRALAADLVNCEEMPTGTPVVVGQLIDRGDRSGYADIPGAAVLRHVAELINCSGGVAGAPIKIVSEELAGDATDAREMTRTLLRSDVDFILGPAFAEQAEPILQITGGEAPVLFAASTEPSLANLEQLSFLVTFDDTHQATAVAEFALGEQKRRAVVFEAPEEKYFGYNAEVFSKVFEKGGGEVVSRNGFVPITQTDFEPDIAALSEVLEGDEVVFLPMVSSQAGELIEKLSAEFDELMFIGPDSFEVSNMGQHPASDGVYHISHGILEPGSPMAKLFGSFEKATGEKLEAGTVPALYVDALLIGLQAMLDCSCSDPAKIGEALGQLEETSTLTGDVTYRGADARPLRQVNIGKYVDGKSVYVTSR